jgi:predicted nucleic acid-binding Zn ribbon protein
VVNVPRKPADDTEPCPYCRQPVYEDAEQCPHCGNYLSEEDAPPRPRSWWIIFGVIVCLAIVLKWIGVW